MLPHRRACGPAGGEAGGEVRRATAWNLDEATQALLDAYRARRNSADAEQLVRRALLEAWRVGVCVRSATAKRKRVSLREPSRVLCVCGGCGASLTVRAASVAGACRRLAAAGWLVLGPLIRCRDCPALGEPGRGEALADELLQQLVGRRAAHVRACGGMSGCEGCWPTVPDDEDEGPPEGSGGPDPRNTGAG